MLFIAAVAKLADTLGRCEFTAHSQHHRLLSNKYLLEVLADWFGGICTIGTI